VTEICHMTELYSIIVFRHSMWNEMKVGPHQKGTEEIISNEKIRMTNIKRQTQNKKNYPKALLTEIGHMI